MAIFPTGVSTDADLYVAVNNKATTLTTALTNVDTTALVTSTTGFPSSGIITVDLEAIKYTGTTPTSFTGLTRGFDGTTAASHAILSSVLHDIPAAHHNNLKDEVIALEQCISDRFGLGPRISKQIIVGTDEITNFIGTPTTGGTLALNTYWYKVFGLNANGYIGIPSDEIVVVVSGANNRVLLSWDAIPNVVSYRIQRGTDQGGGAGYFVTAGTTFDDSGQAFDFPALGAVQAVNQFKLELPGTVDLVAGQGSIRWHDYVDSSLITGSISCTSAGEFELVASQGVVSGMFLFSKYGTASPFNIDLRFTNPRIAFNAAGGEIACGGVVGINIFPTGATQGIQTPQRLGISDGTATIPNLYFIGDTDTGVSRLFSNTISLILGGLEEYEFLASDFRPENTVKNLGAVSAPWSSLFLSNQIITSAITNQIVLGTTRTVTLDAPTPATTSRTWTIPDISSNGTFAALEGTQTFSGLKTFSAAVAITASSGNTFVVNSLDFIVDSTNRRIGIGAAPSQLFEATGVAASTNYQNNLTATSTSGQCFFYPNANVSGSQAGITMGVFGSAAGGTTHGLAQAAMVRFRADTSISSLLLYTAGSAPLRLGTNDTDALFIDGSSQAVSFVGTNTNDNAVAGRVGEYMSAANASGVNFPATTVYGDAASLSLTAGDWDISYQVFVDRNTATWTRWDIGISTTSGNSATGLNVGDNYFVEQFDSSATTPQHASGSISTYRASISATTTFYAKVRAVYSAGQPQYYYRISARRVR